MIDSNSKKEESNKWFEDMVRNINSMQNRFISNMRAKVNEEQEYNKYNDFTHGELDNAEKIKEMLDSVDANTKQFIEKLTQEMDKVIKSHNITQTK